MLKDYAQGFIIPRAFVTEYRGEYGEPRTFDSIITKDCGTVEAVGINMPYEVMMRLDCQDIVALFEFMIDAMPAFYLNEVKKLADAQLAKLADTGSLKREDVNDDEEWSDEVVLDSEI